MAIPTQGTDGFVLVKSPTDPTVCVAMSLGCVTSIDPGTDSTDQIETTCLKVRTTRTYTPGLTTPGQGSFALNADPKEPSHLALFELSKTKEVVDFAVGWSDGPDTAVPGVAQVGGVFSVTVTNGGSGYTAAPTVSFTGGGGGTGATGVAVVEGGKVVGVNITDAGSGYTSVPTVTFTGGVGTGAAATAEVAERCEFIFPTNRTWNTFAGYVAGFPFNFGQNSVVQSAVSLQRSGDNFWIPKTTG